MKVTEYVKKNQEALPPELSELLLQEQSIWTNDACYGYCIRAMESAGYKREEIRELIGHLHRAFDALTVEETEKKWVNW